MEELAPILVMGILWLFIGLPIMAAKKNTANKTQHAAGKKASRPPAADPEPSAPVQEGPPERGPLQPGITLTAHDDSVYQGSLNAVTGEGYDPCHEEQLSPLNAAELSDNPPVQGEPGLTLSWTGSDIVRGFVMSEILNRK